MSVVVSLLKAIDKADGEALVMHVGEKPYVVTATGHADLAPKALTIPAMTGMLEQLLPPDSRQALEELGAVEYHLPPQDSSPGARYSVVAARGGDDIWIEVRRRKEAPAPPPPIPVATIIPDPQPAPVAIVAPAPEVAREPEIVRAPEPAPEPERKPEPELEAEAGPEPEAELGTWNVEPATEPVFELETFSPVAEQEPAAVIDPIIVQEPVIEPVIEPTIEPVSFEPISFDPIEEPVAAIFEDPSGSAETVSSAVAAAESEVAAVPEAVAGIVDDEPEEPEAPAPHLAPVVPLTRPTRVETPARAETPARPRGEGLPYLLQLAAAQGASVLYVAAHAKPSLRVDGEIRVLEHETPLGEAQLESAIVAMLPQGAQITVDEVETCDVPDVGRVQVLAFRDHRGLGAMFKMLPARAISAEQASLGPAIQALCTETEGLVLVAGGRATGKSTLVASLVDQINRTRRDHVITIEHQIQYVHENRTSFISQRETRDDDAFAASVRSALREGPDVLVVDQVTTQEAAIAVLHAASNGHLVIASITAATTTAALQRLVELFGEGRGDARITVSEHLRGVITQTLLRKTGGGRAAAREVLVNVPSVATLVADGHFDQLPGVLNGGRRVGMVPLNDALLGLVQAGALDVREAYRKSPDQNELVSMFNRVGLDTTFAERLA